MQEPKPHFFYYGFITRNYSVNKKKTFCVDCKANVKKDMRFKMLTVRKNLTTTAGVDGGK